MRFRQGAASAALVAATMPLAAPAAGVAYANASGYPARGLASVADRRGAPFLFAHRKYASGSTTACVRINSLRLRLREQGRIRLRSATVFVNGRRVKRLRGSAVTAPFTISHLPRSSFSVKVVALTTRGRTLVTSRRYGNCAKPGRLP